MLQTGESPLISVKYILLTRYSETVEAKVPYVPRSGDMVNIFGKGLTKVVTKVLLIHDKEGNSEISIYLNDVLGQG